MMRIKRHDRGFSLIELGIAVGAVAVLTTIVIATRGFIASSRVGASVQMVQTLQRAARSYAERHHNSLSFDGVTLQTLKDEGLLPPTVVSPWDAAPEVTAEPGGERIRIKFWVPDRPTEEDCRNALGKMGDDETVAFSNQIQLVTQ